MVSHTNPHQSSPIHANPRQLQLGTSFLPRLFNTTTSKRSLPCRLLFHLFQLFLLLALFLLESLILLVHFTFPLFLWSLQWLLLTTLTSTHPVLTFPVCGLTLISPC